MRALAPLAALLVTVLPAASRACGPGSSAAPDPAERVGARLDAGDPAGAVALGEAAVRKSPKDSRLWLALGKAYGEKARTAVFFRQLGLAKKCKAAFERSVELDPDSLEARSALFEYELEAPAVAGGSPSLAKREAEQILKLDTCRGHAALGEIAEREGDFSRAEVEYRMALDAAKNDDLRATVESQLALVREKTEKR